MITNHHAHTHYSDGVGSPTDYVEQALREGLGSYGFSDHAPIPLEHIGSMAITDLGDYLAEIDRLRSAYGEQIRLYKSLEVDYIPEVMNVDSHFIRAARLDYTVGAVHYVDYLPDGLPWSFQRANPVFDRGIDQIFGGDARKMVERYFELVREMVRLHPPDVVAHLDRVKKRNEAGRYWSEAEPWYRRAVEATLEVIAEQGCILEVNTRGIYLHDRQGSYPTDWVVRRAHERGIRLQVNSDAHRPEHVTGGFQEAYAMLEAIGVKEVWTFGGESFRAVGVADILAEVPG